MLWTRWLEGSGALTLVMTLLPTLNLIPMEPQSVAPKSPCLGQATPQPELEAILLPDLAVHKPRTLT